ncbi:hypothetical protein U6B65_07665 [Oscillospiraceae bacterium MB08-C2-2]|nr:hypothetical protein U6B65_07665 [Oscillospiraceae bacterium MB08-C2-2]
MSEERTLQRLLEAFLGKPQTPAPPPSPESIPPIGEMLAELIQLDDRVFGRYAFSRDPLRGKFSPEKMDTLTQQAGQCGREYAQSTAKEHGTSSPQAIAKALDIKVEKPSQPTGTDRVTFAQFAPPGTISIFRHGLEKAEQVLEDSQVRQIMGNITVEDILLAHELFHVVEEKNKSEIFTRTRKVELWAPWPLHNRSTIRSLSEIAGMAFARELTGLPYSPFVLDVFLIYGYAPAAAFSLYSEITGLARKLDQADE